MSLPVLQNGLVPLCYLSPYKDAALFIRARIYNVADTLLATKDLTHVEDGRYTDATYFMPAEPSLKVRYDVFTEASYTSKSLNEGSKDERFDLIKDDDALIRNDELVMIFDEGDLGFTVIFTEDETFNISLDMSDEAISLDFSEDDSFSVAFDESEESMNVSIHECN